MYDWQRAQRSPVTLYFQATVILMITEEAHAAVMVNFVLLPVIFCLLFLYGLEEGGDLHNCRAALAGHKMDFLSCNLLALSNNNYSN